MCKLKWKLGYPVYCPFQIKYGGVWNLPFVRLDDILMREAASEASVNLQRHQENLALKNTIKARKEFLRSLRAGANSSSGDESKQPTWHEPGSSGFKVEQIDGQQDQQQIGIPPLKLDFASE